VTAAVWFGLHEKAGMSDLLPLSDEQVNRRPLCPKSHGKPRKDDRRVLSQASDDRRDLSEGSLHDIEPARKSRISAA